MMLVGLQVSTSGGFVSVAQVTNFPVSTEMSGALVRFAPGALRQLHWHPGHSEWQYLINGSLTVRQNRPLSFLMIRFKLRPPLIVLMFCFAGIY